MKKKIKKVANKAGNALSNTIKTSADTLEKLGSATKDLKKGHLISATGKTLNAIHTAAKGTSNIIKGLNHPEWYTKIGTAGLTGVNVSVRKGLIDNRLPQDIDSYMSVPSIAAIDLDLVKPIGDQGAFDQYIDYMYSSIRKANSGSVNYSVKDLMKYVLTVRSLRACLSDVRRTYGLLNSISFYDSKSPQNYYVAVGKDYFDFVDKSADLRSFGNRLIKTATRMMPLNITLFDRTDWLFSNVFKDSDDAKASLYIFRTLQVPIFNTRNDEIVDIALGSPIDLMGYDDYVSNINDAFEIFRADDKFQTIAGDIMKAFQEHAIYHMSDFPEEYELMPVYDQYILTQIQNLTMMPIYATTANFDLEYEFTGSGISNTLTVTNTIGEETGDIAVRYGAIHRYLDNLFFNTYKNDTPIGEVLAMTRLMQSYDTEISEDGNTAVHACLACGTEVVRQIVMYFTSTDAGIQNNVGYAVHHLGNRADVTVSTWSALDYMPMQYLVNSVNFINGYMFDFNNYGSINDELLSSYTAFAVSSMLDVPGLYKSVNTKVI